MRNSVTADQLSVGTIIDHLMLGLMTLTEKRNPDKEGSRHVLHGSPLYTMVPLLSKEPNTYILYTSSLSKCQLATDEQIEDVLANQMSLVSVSEKLEFQLDKSGNHYLCRKYEDGIFPINEKELVQLRNFLNQIIDEN